jgi:hypothetical protein
MSQSIGANAMTHRARNQFVCQYVGSIENSNEAPCSFHKPLLLEASTRKSNVERTFRVSSRALESL